jgi:hypothetical protein
MQMKNGLMRGPEQYKSVQQLLQEQRDDLAKSKKPILWVHIPYEYNARNWKSFGSRGTFDLNQPYLYLTMQSIVNKCGDSFQVCIVDDQSFEKLIPDWTINMKIISNPINEKIRALGMMKLLSIYGGMIVPVSFLCIRDLLPLYNQGTDGGKMFVCEDVDRNITSTSFDFSPNMQFMGCPKNNNTMTEFLDFMQRIITQDFTAQSKFIGDFNRWLGKRCKTGEVNLIDGCNVGTKNANDEPILIEELLASTPIDVCDNLYGIWIPAQDILSRRKYEWFARMSVTQVVDANLIISKYILMANIIDENGGLITELQAKPNWVSFWSVPSQAPVWGLKPNYLGNNVLQLKEPSYAGN